MAFLSKPVELRQRVYMRFGYEVTRSSSDVAEPPDHVCLYCPTYRIARMDFSLSIGANESRARLSSIEGSTTSPVMGPGPEVVVDVVKIAFRTASATPAFLSSIRAAGEVSKAVLDRLMSRMIVCCARPDFVIETTS